MDTVYRLDWGQRTREIQVEVKGLDDYFTKYEESNVICILGALQAVTSVIDPKSDVIFIEQDVLLILKQCTKVILRATSNI